MLKRLALLFLLIITNLHALDKIKINYKGQEAWVTPNTVLLELSSSKAPLQPEERIKEVFENILGSSRSLISNPIIDTSSTTIYKAEYPQLDLESFIKKAHTHRNIKSMQPNFIYHALGMDGKDQPVEKRGYRWNLQTLMVPQAHQLLNEVQGWNPNVTIAVLDTGIYPHHPAFDNIYYPYNIYHVTFYYNAKVYTTSEEYDAPIMGMHYDATVGDFVTYFVTGGYHDWQGHGTHCAGMVAGNYISKKDFVGVAPGYNIIPVKVLDDSGEGNTAVILQGAMYALQQGADVFSLSLGGNISDGYAQKIYCDEIYSRGIPIVVAAGNTYEQGNLDSYPAALDCTIAVASLGSDDRVAYYSQSHDWVDVAAPGGDGKRKNKSGKQRQVLSTWTADPRATYDALMTPLEPGEDRKYYAGISGTSMATPQVAGIVALMRGIDYSLTPEDIRLILKGTGTPVTGAYHDQQLKKMPGLVKANAYQALNFLTYDQEQGEGPTSTGWSAIYFDVDPTFPAGMLFINRAKLTVGSDDYDLYTPNGSSTDVTTLADDQEVFVLGGSLPPGGDKAILRMNFGGSSYIPDKSVYLNNLSSMGYIVYKSYTSPKFTIMVSADEDNKRFVVKIING